MGLTVGWKSLSFVVLKLAEPRRGAPKERCSKGGVPRKNWKEHLSKINPGLAPLRRAEPRDLEGHMARGTTWLRPQ